MAIAIIDYGMGNLRSVQKGLEHVGFPAFITSRAEEILAAPGVVLPGVGAFADAMKNLRELGLVDVIHRVVQAGTPFLGICLGLQLMFSSSEEDGWHQGLDIFPGKVLRLPGGLKVPHMGWNQVRIRGESPLWHGIPDGTSFYFVHSYYVQAGDPRVVTGVTEYGIPFTSVAGRGNVFGVQFHPEKSSSLGLQVLKNFGGLVASC